MNKCFVLNMILYLGRAIKYYTLIIYLIYVLNNLKPLIVYTGCIFAAMVKHISYNLARWLLRFASHRGKLEHFRRVHKTYHCANVYCIRHVLMHLLSVGDICGLVNIKNVSIG